MGFEYVSKLPTPDEIRAQFPLAPALAAEKAKKDEAIKDVFTGKSDKFLVIIGPCSADREDSVCEYVSRLAQVQEKQADSDSQNLHQQAKNYWRRLQGPAPSAQPGTEAQSL